MRLSEAFQRGNFKLLHNKAKYSIVVDAWLPVCIGIDVENRKKHLSDDRDATVNLSLCEALRVVKCVYSQTNCSTPFGISILEARNYE
jgi:hypothetical protein